MAERGRKLLNDALDGGWDDYAARVRRLRQQTANED
jgi:hypothetical protein